MIVSEVVSRTWQCDGLSCPTSPVVAETSPFFKMVLSKADMPHVDPCQLDLCPVCVGTITAPSAVQYIENLP